MTDCDHAQFAIVPAVIREVERIALKDLRRILEIKPALGKRCGALRRITGNLPSGQLM
jgi:hypothetical protein